jgi:hypothetical protein
MRQSVTGRTQWVYQTGLLGGVAGAAGGVAEILWVVFYGAVVGNDTAEVARSITAVVNAALPISHLIDAPVASGLAIHMLAAVVLGIALAFIWSAQWLRKFAVGNEFTLLPAVLAIIWAFNFFVILPLISPYFADLHRSFTEILPYPVSLFSKLLFGLAAAAVLKRTVADRPVLGHELQNSAEHMLMNLVRKPAARLR